MRADRARRRRGAQDITGIASNGGHQARFARDWTTLGAIARYVELRSNSPRGACQGGPGSMPGPPCITALRAAPGFDFSAPAHAQTRGLGPAQAGGVQQLQQGPVAQAARAGGLGLAQDRLALGRAKQGARQALGLTRQVKIAGRVGQDVVGPGQPLEPQLDRGQVLQLHAGGQRLTLEQLYGQGVVKRRLAKQEGDSRLRRRLLAIEKLDPSEKRQVLQLIDAFIERGQLRSKVHASR